MPFPYTLIDFTENYRKLCEKEQHTGIMQICRNLLKNQNCVTCILSFASKYNFIINCCDSDSIICCEIFYFRCFSNVNYISNGSYSLSRVLLYPRSSK